MRAARMVAPRKLEMIEIPDPVRNKGEVLVRLIRITICGSDLHDFRGRTPRDYPWDPGRPAHECLGRVVEEDPDLPFREGQMVLVRPPEGGLRELAGVTPENLCPVGEGIRDPDLAVMAQLLAPVLHGCKRLGDIQGKTVFVLGQGPAGLTLTDLIKGMGARSIVTADLVPERREESLRRGADESLEGGPGLLGRVAETGRQCFEVVVEAVGDQETIELAPHLACEMGSLLFFGLPAENATLRLRSLFGKQLRMTTSEYPERADFLMALKLIADGRIDMGRMITHRLPFDEVQEGYELADTREDGVLRVVLNMEDGNN
jgi:L-iditol 2-dehydrogenase